ncbi:DUF4430 domain-containing protein [Candidatus Woesearchaeota archaeon]|nr:DUF4430 domain-containing protein [Candidatus Woesearchaeota archaeon]
MKGVLTLTVLAALVAILAFGGYVVGSKGVSSGKQVTLIVSTLGKTSTEHFDIDGFTALDLLGSTHDVKTIADYIKCVDGICVSKEYAWSYYVNGKLVPRSASTYLVKRGDIIEFRFEKTWGG